MATVWIYGDDHLEDVDSATEKASAHFPEEIEVIVVENPNRVEPAFGRWVYLLNPVFVLFQALRILTEGVRHYATHRTLRSAGDLSASRIGVDRDIPVTYTDVHWRDRIADQGWLLTVLEVALLFLWLRLIQATIAGGLGWVQLISFLVLSTFAYGTVFLFWSIPVRERRMYRDVMGLIQREGFDRIALSTGSAHVDGLERRLEGVGVEVRARHHEGERSLGLLRPIIEWGRC